MKILIDFSVTYLQGLRIGGRNGETTSTQEEGRREVY